MPKTALLIYAQSPEHAVALAQQGFGQVVHVGGGPEIVGQTDSGWSTETLLIWGMVGFVAGGIVGGLMGWQACASMELGKAVAGNLPHLLPLLAAA